MTHWKKLTNPNYLGAYSIEDGQDLVLTIGKVSDEMVIGADGKKEECVVCRFLEPNTKPMILNSTNMKMISKLLKSPYIENWTGLKIQIGTEKVKAFGEVVDALRVRNKLPPNRTEPLPKCCECGGNITATNGMTPEQVSNYTKSKYGQQLCGKCAAEIANEIKKGD